MPRQAFAASSVRREVKPPGADRPGGAEDCKRIVAQSVAALGGLDILINNDGAPPLGPSLAFSDNDWSKASIRIS